MLEVSTDPVEAEGQSCTCSVQQEVESGPDEVLAGQHPVPRQHSQVSHGVVELWEEREPQQWVIEIHLLVERDFNW